MLLSWMFISSYTTIYFFVKKFIFSNVYISVNTIFECLYMFFGWGRGHQLSTYATGGGREGVIEKANSCVQVTSHVYGRTYTIRLSWSLRILGKSLTKLGTFKPIYLNFHWLNDSWTRGFELVTRGFKLVTRGLELVTRGFELVTRGFELVTRRFELVIRRSKVVTRGFELVARGFKLPTRGFELVTRKVELATRKFEFMGLNSLVTRWFELTLLNFNSRF